ncbi:carbohydrate ABC transporter permease [Paenibacillus nasutitermitis]|uniref:ABC transporter permease protein YtcP n=1 Tax=Paenibacillus nasutitermitis TaxID=1652958 RepID=A0A916YUF9_9BACL|nr:carbohydrate ABC transporter permease [Paenibacillus nasutitermitis]GGD61663.1 putative ABC transporter permease protein YtcP [Paenibacillus nasutitermitis]
MVHMTFGEKMFQYVLLIFIVLICGVMIYPFIHMLAVSFSTPIEAIRPGLHLIPLEFSLDAYKQAFASQQIWIGFGNTIFRTVVGTLLGLFFMSITAYPLAKKQLPHRKWFTLLIVFTMFFQGGLIPTYLLIKNIGLINTQWVYILAPPFLISTFSLIILRNFFMNIPSELEDSAKIDGANEVRILFSLVIPLSKPILATVGLWLAVSHWNAWFDGLLYIQDTTKMLLQIYLRRLVIDNSQNEMSMIMDQMAGDVVPESIKAAVLMIATIPILLVYPFLQKYFVKGIFIGSLKG